MILSFRAQGRSLLDGALDRPLLLRGRTSLSEEELAVMCMNVLGDSTGERSQTHQLRPQQGHSLSTS